MNAATSSHALAPLIEKLDEPYRMLCKARYLEGRSVAGLAKHYLLRPDHVQADLDRGRRMLLAMAVEEKEAR